MGKMWNIRKVTAEMISFAAIIVCLYLYRNAATRLLFNLQLRYIVSGDPSLTKVGAKTKINYWIDFRQYQKFFVKYAGTDAIKDIYAFFNERVFADIYEAGHEEDEEEMEFQGDDLEDFGAALAAERRDEEGPSEEEDSDEVQNGDDQHDLEFETGGHGSYYEGDEIFDLDDDHLGDDTSSPREHEIQLHNNSTSVPLTTTSSSRLVSPEAATPGIEIASRSTEALHSRPRRPPTIASTRPAPRKDASLSPAQPEVAAPPTVPAQNPFPTTSLPTKPVAPPRPHPIAVQPPAGANTQRRSTARLASRESEVTVLSTVIEESQSSSSQTQTRKSSRTTRQAITTQSLPEKQVDEDEGRAEGAPQKKGKKSNISKRASVKK